MLILFSLCVAAAGSSRVGRWDGEIRKLPDPKLPHVPLLGNGYMGVLVDTNDRNKDSFGPGRAGAVDFWVNTNAVWNCTDAPGAEPPVRCGRRAFGGVSFRASPAGGSSSSTFAAEQRITAAELWTSREWPQLGALETSTFMHPAENVFVTTLTWRPAAGGPLAVSVEASAWVLTAGAGTAANATAGGGVVSRRMSGGDRSAHRAMWTATAVHAAHGGAAQGSRGDGGGCTGMRVSYNVSSGVPLVVTAALADNLLTSNAEDPSQHATELAVQTTAQQVTSAAQAHWAQFWAASGVSLPTLPEIETMWYGLQYVTACMTPTVEVLARYRGLAPPSGLYGPWVTSDNPSWNGDYTLDYNQEAQYYGVYSSNHPELAAAYFPPIVDWQSSARALAQSEARTAGIACSPKALHYACHLAPWGYQSDDTTIYMHWNGMFAALLFINDFEYTRNLTFAREVTYPLLDGLNEWSHCYLLNSTTPGGAWVLEDWNPKNPDAEHEGQKVRNPQIALALVRRMASAQLSIAAAIGETPPPHLHTILDRLVPFNSRGAEVLQCPGKLRKVWTAFTDATVIQSDMFAVYPLWPSEVVNGLSADPDTLRTARATSRVYSDLARGRPVLLFPAAVRATAAAAGSQECAWTAADILAGLHAYLGNFNGPNLLPYAPGGGTENVGISQALNDMLLQAPDAEFLQLFPVWPLNESAAFTQLRAKGGWVVSAAYNGTTRAVSSASVRATVAGRCTLVNPWHPGAVLAVCAGRRLSLTGVRPSWDMAAGEQCDLQPQPPAL